MQNRKRQLNGRPSFAPANRAYCATKHALEAISDALRMEVWNTGIKVVSTVTRSKTAMLRNSRFASAYRKYFEDVPKDLPARVVADVIVEAIDSPNPKTRYLLGSGKEKAGIRLRPYIPDSLFCSQVAKRLT